MSTSFSTMNFGFPLAMMASTAETVSMPITDGMVILATYSFDTYLFSDIQ